MAQLVKNPSIVWETWVQSLGWEDPLKKGKATHSSILAWKISWTVSWGHKESDTTEQLSLSGIILCTVHRKLNKEIPAFNNELSISLKGNDR